MGIMEDQRNEKRDKARRKGSKPTGAVRPYTFHPTVDQRSALRESPRTSSEIIEGLGEWLLLGHKITLGNSDRGDGVYALIRQGGVPWQEAQTVFVYHYDLRKALQGLDYFLRELAPEFPRLPGQVREDETDW